MRWLAVFAAVSLTACWGKVTDDEDQPVSRAARVGDACASDGDCLDATGSSVGLSCARTVYGLTLPGGYCTRLCSGVSDCPGDDGEVACVVVLDANKPPNRSTCLNTCHPEAPDTGCRDGYACRTKYEGDQPDGPASCWAVPF